MSLLAQILSSKVRAEIFRLLFGLSDQSLHLRELARRSGFAIGTIQTEMKKLAGLDLVERRKDGNRVYYEANQKHPLFSDIQQLVFKTSGFVDAFKRALGDEEAIRVAFLFGSAATGKLAAESDVDLLVIGDIGLRRLLALLTGIGERIGREINPIVMSAREFGKRVADREHFITAVMEGPKHFIVGSADDLIRPPMNRH
jgi:DNA-binding transcriptional ArsR family regulator